MNFDDVRKQLQAKNLNLGLWLEAVIDGEVAPLQVSIDGEVVPLRLRPRFIYDIENTRLAHFAFRRDQIRQYLLPGSSEIEIRPFNEMAEEY